MRILKIDDNLNCYCFDEQDNTFFVIDLNAYIRFPTNPKDVIGAYWRAKKDNAIKDISQKSEGSDYFSDSCIRKIIELVMQKLKDDKDDAV
jgi:hypothetical protein